ncbi:hypothetical protein MPER_03570, partial [Moniliophthora perniciosa FA553]
QPEVLHSTAVGALQAYRIAQRPGINQSLKNLLILQLLLTVFMISVTRVSALSLQAKTGLPPLSQALGWIILLSSASIPFLAPVQHNSADSKFLMHFLGLGPLFIILSLSDEVFFFVSYSMTLYLWTEVEKS